MHNFFTERFVFTTNFLAAGWIAAGVATAAIGQTPPAGNGNVPRADDIAAMDTQLRKMDGGKIGLIEHRAGRLCSYDQIDSDKDGVVSVTEMKAAGVIK